MQGALRVVLLLGLGIGCGSRDERGTSETALARAEQGTEPRALRPQPKPGERVPVPELDGYCAGTDRAGAYYYHGGSPVMRIARKDGCAPLYITECESDGRCYPPRDQEPGMWCCGAGVGTEQTAQATR